VADEHLSKNEFVAHMGPIKEDIAEIVRLQREQNGRVGKVETRVAILEDRSPKREAVGISAVVSAIVNGIAMWVGAQK
jgi:hypothetical protein